MQGKTTCVRSGRARRVPATGRYRPGRCRLVQDDGWNDGADLDRGPEPHEFDPLSEDRCRSDTVPVIKPSQRSQMPWLTKPSDTPPRRANSAGSSHSCFSGGACIGHLAQPHHAHRITMRRSWSIRLIFIRNSSNTRKTSMGAKLSDTQTVLPEPSCIVPSVKVTECKQI